MKIGYVGPCWDATGYAVGANMTILGLDKAGIDVVVRPIKLTGQSFSPPNRVVELQKKDTVGVDAIVQHVLPPLMVYQGGVKNIGYFYAETTHFRPSNWQQYLNLMDEIWVSCPENLKAAELSGVHKPIKVVPIPCDRTLFDTKFEPLNLKINNRYVFYNIADYSERKNIKGLLLAYFQEFSKSDKVVLVLKTYADGKSSQQSLELIKNDIQKIKVSLRKYNIDYYPSVILLTDYLSNEQIYRIHATGNCFVSPERGAAWNIPAFEAIAFGKHVILNGWGGQTQFAKSGDRPRKNVRLLPYKFIPVSGMQDCPYPNLYTCYEEWAEPDIMALRANMREAFNKRLGVSPAKDEEFLAKYDINNTTDIFKEMCQC